MDKQTAQALMERLERDAHRIASRFGLRFQALLPERANVKSRYGLCTDDGIIKIRLNHATTRRPLKYSSLVNTLCHELAHLRHFNHGPRFKAFYFQLLAHARAQGIYRPGPARPSDAGTASLAVPQGKAEPVEERREEAPGPVQLGLF